MIKDIDILGEIQKKLNSLKKNSINRLAQYNNRKLLRPGSKNWIVTAFAYYLASNEVKIIRSQAKKLT